MLDTIHIIDEHQAKPKPISSANPTQNFTMPGRDPVDMTLGLTASPFSSLGLFSLPASLAFAAVTGIPGLASLAFSEKEEDRAARAEKERLLAAFVERATYSPTQAKQAGYRFQPGHPMIGKSYRRHPLADFSGTETEHLYIPSEGYDAHVLEEREAELIRLLVSLGATRISITKKSSNNKDSQATVEGSVDAGTIVKAATEYGSSSQQAISTLDTRVFNLQGSAWSMSRPLDRSGFYWLAFEPSWKAVLFAREYGGCTEASLELKENTSFSENRSFELTVKAREMGGGVSADWRDSSNAERTHLVSVQFSPLSPSDR